MNNHLHEILEKKLYMSEKRYKIEQKNIWLYKTMLEQLGRKPRKKIEQLEMFTA